MHISAVDALKECNGVPKNPVKVAVAEDWKHKLHSDRQVKSNDDSPTIGILLCESKNQVVAQYSVEGMTKPMGISEYELSEALSQRLQACRLEREESH